MEKKETIDVYEILKQCAKENMKLWSPIIGECTLKGLRKDVKLIMVGFTDSDNDSCEWKFKSNGFTASAPMTGGAEVCLFPSKEMRDWEKLLWKTGDVLSDVEGNEVMFDQWDDSDYSSFRALFDILPDGEGFKISKNTEGYSTKDYWKISDSMREDFLAIIEKHAHYKFNEEKKEFESCFKDGDFIAAVKADETVDLMIVKSIQDKRIIALHFPKTDDGQVILAVGTVDVNSYYKLRIATDEEKKTVYNILAAKGKTWNTETLEIENVQEPNDGDVVYLPEIEDGTYPVIFIFKEIANGNIYDHASLVFENRHSPRLCIDGQNTAWESDKKYMRTATEEQKQQLFDELEKAGKRWNPDTKQIEDVKKKHEFKPFEPVLVRDEPDDCWQANLFSCMNNKESEYQFACVSEAWKYCIPYNEKTMHLLGTNDDYEEGGSDE